MTTAGMSAVCQLMVELSTARILSIIQRFGNLYKVSLSTLFATRAAVWIRNGNWEKRGITDNYVGLPDLNRYGDWRTECGAEHSA
jgi:hypothetical protein